MGVATGDAIPALLRPVVGDQVNTASGRFDVAESVVLAP